MTVPGPESLLELAPELRLIGQTEAEVWDLFGMAETGSDAARAFLEVLCLRETIGRMVLRDILRDCPALAPDGEMSAPV